MKRSTKPKRFKLIRPDKINTEPPQSTKRRGLIKRVRVGGGTFFRSLIGNNKVAVRQTPPVVLFEIVVVLFIIKLVFDYLV